MGISARIGAFIAGKLNQPISGYAPVSNVPFEALQAALEPGDVILVEGMTRVSDIIKYLTQSTWSHAALYTGPMPGATTADGETCCVVEAELGQGVICTPLSKYRDMSIRICRPQLTHEDREKVIAYVIQRVGNTYDLKNVFDLMRYLVPTPFPARIRRKMIAFGSGDPSRCICSTLIAQAFQSVRYPILPRVEIMHGQSDEAMEHMRKEILHIRHHALFTPRDFDVSPYFDVVKPLMAGASHYQTIAWNDRTDRTTSTA
jgi:Permuted papain-like amidase enzyme, YaeF/YiiX, C92 family